MGKTRDLLKKIGDIMGTFQARKSMIKGRNSKDITEAKEIKKSCKNTQKNIAKMVLMTGITMMVWSLTQSQAS